MRSNIAPYASIGIFDAIENSYRTAIRHLDANKNSSETVLGHLFAIKNSSETGRSRVRLGLKKNKMFLNCMEYVWRAKKYWE